MSFKNAFHRDLVIRRFQWSGINTHGARIRAGKKLAAFVERLKNDHPGRPLFLIAHSHGGNVVGYALRHEPIKKALAGVVCMGTPFIQVQRREVRQAANLMSWLVPLIVGAVFLGILISSMAFWGNYGESRLAAWAAERGHVTMVACSLLPVALFIGSISILGVLISMANRAHSWIKGTFLTLLVNYQSRRLDELSCSFNGACPLYAIRVKGDEAGHFLALLGNISEVFPRLWRFCASLWPVLVAIFIASYIAMVAQGLSEWNAGYAPAPLWESRFVADPTSMFSLSYLGFFVWILILLCLQFGMLVTPLITRSHILGFGGENVLDNWVLKIVAKALPDNVPEASFEEILLPSWRLHRALRHSVYEQEHAVTAIVAWICKRLGAEYGKTA